VEIYYGQIRTEIIILEVNKQYDLPLHPFIVFGLHYEQFALEFWLVNDLDRLGCRY